MTSAGRRVLPLLLLLVANPIAPTSPSAQAPDQPHVTRIVIKLRFAPERAAATRLQDLRARHGIGPLQPVYAARNRSALDDRQSTAEVRRRYPARSRRQFGSSPAPELSRTYVFDERLGSRAALDALLSRLSRDADVEYAEEDKLATIDFVPNDPYYATTGSWGQAFDDLYGLKKLGMESAWDSTAGQGVTVAVVDTGIDAAHVDITSNVWVNLNEVSGNGIDDDGNGYVDDVRGWDFCGARSSQPLPDADPADGHGHGTHVAGTIAAQGNNGAGIVGVAWQAKVMAVKALDDSGSGYDTQLANAIVYAADNGADVINASWGGSGASQTIADAVNYAASLGVVFVASAGNAAADARDFYPAGLANVITVAASDASDQLATFSNRGPKIDVAAPGVDILSLRAAGTSMGTPLAEGYTRANGTSMAAPHVAGVAALVLATHPTYSTEQVRQAIRVSAADAGGEGYDDSFGYGRISADQAVLVDGALNAAIQTPADSASVSGLVTLTGLAYGPGFASYDLAYGPGSTPSEWTHFLQTSTPAGADGQAPGTLGVLDTSALPDGVYTIRLTAHDAGGRLYVDRRLIVVDYVRISNPSVPRDPSYAATVKGGVVLPIEGVATGPSFIGYRVEWARGINPPSGWSASGITLQQNGALPIESGVVARWDTAAVANGDYYTIRLLVDNASFTSESRSLVYIEPALLSANWPVVLRQGPWPGVATYPMVGGSGERMLAVHGAFNGNLKLWKILADGSATELIEDANGGYTVFQGAVAELDGHPGDEFIVGHSAGLRIFPATGGGALQLAAAPGRIPLVEDVDGIPGPEILIIATNFGLGTGRLQALKADGTALGGAFPVAIEDRNQGLSNTNATQRLVVADLDDDGSKEIVVAEGPTASSVRLTLLNADGTPRTWASPAFEGELPHLAAADLDADGALEILALVKNPDGTRTLHVLALDGSPKPGWPFSLPGGESGLALADFDRDGTPEIVLPAAYKMFVLRGDGQTFSSAWPATRWEATGGALYFGAPVTGDLDGDGIPEIVTPTCRNETAPNPLFPLGAPSAITAASTTYYEECRVAALRRDGTLSGSWRVPTVDGKRTVGLAVAAIADVDADNTTDIVVSALLAAPGQSLVQDSVLAVLAIGSPYKAGANDWPTRRHDARNTAVLPRDRIAPVVTLTSPQTGTTIADTTALTADASDEVFIKGVQFQVDGADVGAEDLAAPFEVQWDPRSSGNGAHVLTAVARDSSGNRRTSAPVTVTVDMDLTSPETAITFPADGAIVSSTTPVLAGASDDRNVERVELYVDDVLAGVDTTAPYEFAWDARNATDGGHRLTVKAFDAAGNVGVSAAVDVIVAVAPQVSFMAPAAGAALSGVTTLQASATDNTAVTRVEFYAQDLAIGADTSAPWTLTWNTVTVVDGPIALSARAYDAAGNSASTSIGVMVANPPSVSITSPAPSTVVAGPIAVTADASDAGGIARVELLVDGTLMGTDSEAPYAFTWDPSFQPDGWHNLVARAVDAAGHAGSSSTVSVRVMVPPLVAVTSPVAGAVLAGTVSVTAEASDNLAVTRAELYVDGLLRLTTSTAPWTFTVDTLAYSNGAHTLIAKAYDAAGNIGVSASVPVTVDNNVAVYDPVLRAPRCGTIAAICTSGTLLNGRGTIGPEPNQPNTIHASCSDGSSGSYHVDESNDRITIATVDGSPLGYGKTVEVRATVWAYAGYSSDKLDLYYTANAQSPSWTLIGTFTPAAAGAQTIRATYTLPMGSLQAVRARFRYSGSAAPCTAGGYDDHDDLVFAVEMPVDSGPPTAAITSPAAGATVTSTITVTADAADDVGVTRVELYADSTYIGSDTVAPYAMTLNPAGLQDGSRNLTVKAYDFAGNVTTSGAVPVTIAVPPSVSITSPSSGSTISGAVTVTAQAYDNGSVARVEFFVDGALRSTDSTSPYSFAWDTAAETTGAHTLTARAYDLGGNAATSAAVAVQVQRPPAGSALYDAVLRAPKCGDAAPACDSGSLLVGRGTRGPEPNASNTIGGSCTDGNYGTFHVDESSDRIRVTTLDGTTLAPGKTARIEVTVWAYSSYTSDKLDLYYAATANSPTWTYLTTLTPTKSGSQVLSATYTLPAGSLQAVRANFRYSGAASVCSTGGYDDHDDLIFAVQVQ